MVNSVGIAIENASHFFDISRAAKFNQLLSTRGQRKPKASTQQDVFLAVHIIITALRSARQLTTEEVQKDQTTIWMIWCSLLPSFEYHFNRCIFG